jgi:hypothetical protein
MEIEVRSKAAFACLAQSCAKAIDWLTAERRLVLLAAHLLV